MRIVEAFDRVGLSWVHPDVRSCFIELCGNPSRYYVATKGHLEGWDVGLAIEYSEAGLWSRRNVAEAACGYHLSKWKT